MKLQKALWIGVLALLLAFSPVSDKMPASVSTVYAAPTKLNYTKKNLVIGQTFTLKSKVGKAAAYQSSNKSIATVTKKGVVKAKAPGDVIITVTTKTGKKYTCKVSVRNQVDFIIFAGQSNMTNVGKASEAPVLKDGAAYEVLLTKKKLSPLREPFGVQQKGKVTSSSGGTLVSAFANSYYSETGIPIVATSVARGNTSIGEWSRNYYKNIISSTKKAEKILKKQGINVRHRYLVFFQGENDASYNLSTAAYQQELELMFKNVRNKTSIEKCLLIRIGKNLNSPTSFDRIAAAQTITCMENPSFVLISTIASGLDSGYYQSDGVHYTQKGLNIIGKQAGKMAGKYANTGVEPSMKDPRYNNTYTSNSN